MSQIADKDSPTPVDDSGHSQDRRTRRRVIAGCMAGALVFLGAVTMLYTQWIHADSPTCLIVVVGDESLDDATVTVAPMRGTNMQPLHAQIKDGFGHRLRFHLSPGVYSVSVRDASKRVIFPDRPSTGEFDLAPNMKGFIQLRGSPSIKENP